MKLVIDVKTTPAELDAKLQQAIADDVAKVLTPLEGATVRETVIDSLNVVDWKE